MFNLMKLEYKKFKLQNLTKGVVIANLILLAAIVLMGIGSVVDMEAMFVSVEEGVLFVELLVVGTFIVYGSVVLAKLTVSEYKNKTIQLMFMYPINRKKLLISKLIIVYLFTTITVLISNIFILTGVSIIDHYIDFIPGIIDLKSIRGALPTIVAAIMMSGFLAIVPLYFGMRKKSTVHTIIASLIVVCLTSSNMGPVLDITDYLYRILILGIVAIISIILTVIYTLNNIDHIECE